ncbi:MAG TPA: serine/threonine-protein kinase [Gaiellaceae bacterium]|nr:serine/threonine-protein kinase [Gaiellaceae bacterium]
MAEASVHAAARGLVLGRYRPIKPLGSGGMGSVWHAFDERKGREVALKIVARAGTAGPRAEREATAATQLKHPACLRAYALARDDGHVYIAYEYVPGRTLRHALGRGELDDEAAIEVAAQILDGLAHAHERGIVHRDVKPANILLADGPDTSVRILDFGLALVREEETLTAAGDVPGTLAYISPERLAGEQAGPPTDVWSTGVLLWEALAGRHPFGAGPFLELAKRIGRGAPSLGSARPDLPKPLVRLVDSALSPDPDKRPTAAALAVALRRAPRRRPRSSVARPRVSLPSLPSLPAIAPAKALQRGLRVAPALPAALLAGWTSSSLAFFPAYWPIGLAALAAVLAYAAPRLGAAFALAVPILPLGNISLGLAIVYAVLALGWIVLFWPRPRTALLFVAGPLLAPVGLLGVVPLAVLPAGTPVRRAAQAAAAVAAATVVAALGHHGLPLVGDEVPDLSLGGLGGPAGAAAELWHGVFAARPLLLEALVLAAAAAAADSFRRRGPWGGAVYGAALVALTLLVAPGAAALPLVAAAWICGFVLAAEPETPRRPARIVLLVRGRLKKRPRLRPVHGS